MKGKTMNKKHFIFPIALALCTCNALPTTTAQMQVHTPQVHITKKLDLEEQDVKVDQITKPFLSLKDLRNQLKLQMISKSEYKKLRKELRIHQRNMRSAGTGLGGAFAQALRTIGKVATYTVGTFAGLFIVQNIYSLIAYKSFALTLPLLLV